MDQPVTTSEAQSRPASAEPATNAAVLQCCSAYHLALAAVRGAKGSESIARDKAKEAFRSAMPFPASRSGIFDFIACVTQGMLMGVYWNDEGPRLTRCAKAALAALPRETR